MLCYVEFKDVEDHKCVIHQTNNCGAAAIDRMVHSKQPTCQDDCLNVM